MRWLVALLLLQVLYQEAVPAHKRKRIDSNAKGNVTNGCSFNISSDFPKSDPVILAVKGRIRHLAIPEDGSGILQINEGDQLLLSCPGQGNRLENISGSPSSVQATCRNNKLQVDQHSYSLQEFGCKNKVHGEIFNTNRTCGPKQAQLLELGYLLEKKWYPLLSVCHVRNRSSTIYSKHILHGKLIAGSDKETTRPIFRVGGDFYPNFSPEVAYRKSTQKKTLQKLLASSKLAEEYLSTTFLARGHLAPDGDFILNAHQYLTYFYVNTVPQWQSSNVGNWLSLEKTIRKLGKYKRIDLEIVTGSYDVLKLEADSGQLREIYMYYNESRNPQLPVPKFIWKIVYDNATKEGIAFVTLNNPFITQVTLNEQLCTNICKENRWLPKSESWTTLKKGYLYCCEIGALRKVISYIPKLDVTGILQGPN